MISSLVRLTVISASSWLHRRNVIEILSTPSGYLTVTEAHAGICAPTSQQLPGQSTSHQLLDLFSKLRFIVNDRKMNSEDHTHPNTTENNKEMVALLNSHSALAYISKDRLKSYFNTAEFKGKLDSVAEDADFC